MTHLADQLDDAALGAGEVLFASSGRVVAVAELWRRAGRAAAALDAMEPSGGTVAMALEAGPDALVAFLAALRAGRRVVSLPLPSRGAPVPVYLDLVARILDDSRARLLLVDPARLAGLPPLGIGVSSFDALGAWPATAGRSAWAGGRGDADQFELVQFSSGSTSEPKGIVLDGRAIGANVAAIIDRLEPQAGDGACSWLPWSHDMGLIGMVLTGLVATGPRHAGGGRLTLLRPEAFVRDPAIWMRCVSEQRATITAGPDFAYRLATRRADGSLDLRSLRCAIVGGEPVDPWTLWGFVARHAGSGFSSAAFCPAYGLAEMTLAVTMARPGQLVWTRSVDGAEPTPSTAATGATALVSCGRPLAGYEVRAGRAGQPAPILVRGPSAVRSYLGTPGRLPDADGWLATHDIGVVERGELFVQGRVDDVVVVAGRNLHLGDIDRSLRAAAVPGVAAVYSCAHPAGGYAVMAELVEASVAPDALVALGRAAIGPLGPAPTEVVVVAKGALPRTASGKPQRRRAAALLDPSSTTAVLGRRRRIVD